MTPEELIAEQDATITELRAQLAEDYWSNVYDRIRAAWDAWALAELGTASPSVTDLEGRPELAQLWESVK